MEIEYLDVSMGNTTNISLLSILLTYLSLTASTGSRIGGCTGRRCRRRCRFSALYRNITGENFDTGDVTVDFSVVKSIFQSQPDGVLFLLMKFHKLKTEYSTIIIYKY